MEAQAPKKVVLALIEHGGKFLLIRRRLPFFKLEWAFPGGIIEGEETEEEAVVREAKDEISEMEWVPAENVLDRFTSDVHPVIREFVLSCSRRGKEL